jgi:hypothetical protein
MPRLFTRVKKVLSNGVHWWLDYAYVTYWQMRSGISRVDISRYKNGNDTLPVVLLLPGIYERWQFLKPLADAIDQAGYRLHVVTELGRNSQSVEVSAEVVERYVEGSALGEYVIVAHSKGGLVGKYVMGGRLGKRCLGMVAVNTPFSGSSYARLFFFGPLKMFSPRATIIGILGRLTRVNKRIVSLYSEFDPHIPAGSELVGATNVTLPLKGHFKPLGNALLRHTVVQYLDILAKKKRN